MEARARGSTAAGDGAGEFVEFFAEGWRIGAHDPERFFAHFEPRVAADARFAQPLAREQRGPSGLRNLFEPLFAAVPDLGGEVVRWGATADGVVVELRLSSAATGIAWTSIDVIELRDGVIAARRAHFDSLPLAGSLLRRPRILLKLLPSLVRG